MPHDILNQLFQKFLNKHDVLKRIVLRVNKVPNLNIKYCKEETQSFFVKQLY